MKNGSNGSNRMIEHIKNALNKMIYMFITIVKLNNLYLDKIIVII